MAEEKLDLFEFAATTMADPRPLLLWNIRWNSLAASEISRWRNAQRKSERQILDENLPYRLLLGAASQQVSGALVRDADYTDKWIATANKMRQIAFLDPAAFTGNNPWMRGVRAIPSLKVETWGSRRPRSGEVLGMRSTRPSLHYS